MGNCLASVQVFNDNYSNNNPISAFADMHAAVLAQDVILLKKALANGADANPDRRFRTLTPLMWAAIKGHTSCMKVLLDYGAEIDATSESGLTPTMFATIAGRPDCLRLLLARGAKADAVTIHGKNALQLAIERGQAQCAGLLIYAGRIAARSHPVPDVQTEDYSVRGGMSNTDIICEEHPECEQERQLKVLPILERLSSLSAVSTESVLLGGEYNADLFINNNDKSNPENQRGCFGPLQHWVVPQEQLMLGQLIGSGAISRVYVGSWQGSKVAIKTFVLPQTEQNTNSVVPIASNSSFMRFQREAEVLGSIRHPNFANFLALCLEPPCLVTEKCKNGSLFDFVQNAKDDIAVSSLFTWDKRLSIADEIASGIAYLHQRPVLVVHRNLKSSNILIDGSFNAKISGLGLSKPLDEEALSKHTVLEPFLKDPRWAAPESLKKNGWSLASDVYSFGIILWELMTWERPWSHLSSDCMLVSLGNFFVF